MKLSDNTILITGGTSGIGFSLGKALLEMHNTVILLGRNKEKLREAKNLGFETICCDLNKQEDIEEACVRIQNNYPQLNMLFNNAGVQYNYYFTDAVVPMNKIISEIFINVTGQIILTQLLIPILNNNPNATIVNTTSGLGAFPKNDGLVYSVSKAAMRNFTTGLRNSLKKNSIRVIEFIPPVTDTGMTAGRNEQKMSTNNLIRHILPQLRKDKKIVTVFKVRIFLWLSIFMQPLANKIINQ